MSMQYVMLKKQPAHASSGLTKLTLLKSVYKQFPIIICTIFSIIICTIFST